MRDPPNSNPSESQTAPTPARQARLKPQYAPLYPDVPPGAWTAATTLAQTLMAGLSNRDGPGAIVEVRLLDDEHFEFRGGQGPPTLRRKSRATDRM